MIDYTLIKSRRKTISVELRRGEVIVRAPMRTTKREADAFVLRHTDWIERHRAAQRERMAQAQSVPKLSPDELRDLARQAAEAIPARVRHYAALLGESCGRITIRCQRTRWGSCSAKRNLNFNCLLMLTPPAVIDAVVVHEVCHLREMNHSERFYALVLGLCPDYRAHDRWLKEHGRAILARLPEKEST